MWLLLSTLIIFLHNTDLFLLRSALTTRSKADTAYIKASFIIHPFVFDKRKINFFWNKKTIIPIFGQIFKNQKISYFS